MEVNKYAIIKVLTCGRMAMIKQLVYLTRKTAIRLLGIKKYWRRFIRSYLTRDNPKFSTLASVRECLLRSSMSKGVKYGAWIFRVG